MAEFTTRTNSVAGFDITTRVGGNGPPLLYLHGAGGASGFFAGGAAAPFLNNLANSFSVWVPEHPGYGPIETPVWLDNIHDLAYFYLDYIDALGLSNVHLVGSSIGGWLALELAVRDTSSIKSLTLCGAAGLRVKGVPMGDLFLWSKEQFAENCLRNEQVRAKFLAFEPTPEQEIVQLRNQQTSALLAWEPRLHNPNLHKWLHRIDIPTHIVWASDDRLIPQPYADALVEHIPGSTLSIIPDSGHLMNMDNPEAFCSTITGFIKEKAS